MIYVSSKLRHADVWKQAREKGWPIISSWIDGEKIETAAELDAMWDKYLYEIAHAGMLVLYVRSGLVLKGALIEVGAAMAQGKPIVVIWDGSRLELEEIVGTWINHKSVSIVKDVEDVIFVR
jgi:hypothetical protein